MHEHLNSHRYFSKFVKKYIYISHQFFVNQINSLIFNENIFSQAKHRNILTCKKQIENGQKHAAYFLNTERKSSIYY